MGCTSSTPQRDANEDTLTELVSRRHEKTALIRNTILQAFLNMAAFLNEQGASITIISIGGAVNTIYLRSQTTTLDADFFYQRLQKGNYAILQKAIQYARSRNQNLGDEWFNNRTVLLIPEAQRDRLTTEAFEQNEVVFNAPGLRVLAAPWPYAICAKLERISGGGIMAAKPHDYPDAAIYLRHFLQKRRVQGVRLSAIRGWAQHYQLRVRDEVINQLNALYERSYGQNAILMNA